MEKKRVALAQVVLLSTLAAAFGIIFGVPSSGDDGSAPTFLPDGAESAKVEKIVAENTTSGSAPMLAVVTRSDGGEITDADKAAGMAAYKRMMATDRKIGAAEEQQAAQGMPPFIPSKDGKAILFLVPITTELDGFNLIPVVDEVREAAQDGLPDSLQLNTTGGPAFAADSANAFEGADFRLLALSAAVVAVLLLLTYRSPILWIIPLLIVGVADRVATVLAGNMLEAAGYSFDASTAGIVSVLVFGAGTNYALLLTSRYRDELRLDHNKQRALWKAWKGSLPAILASNLTVVAAILMLLLSTQPNIRNLGAGAPIGLLVALFATLTALPAAYLIAPRWVFWPFVPKPDEDAPADSAEEATAELDSEQAQNKAKAPDNKWYSVANWVSKRPTTVLAAGTILLILLSLGMTSANYGLSQTEQFTTDTESVAGLDQLENHYPAGFASGIDVVASTEVNPMVLQKTLQSVKGVQQVAPNPLDKKDEWQRWNVFTDYEPGTPEALQVIDDMRGAFSGEVYVGGSDAKALDQANAAKTDMKLVFPLVLLVVFAMLVVVLRAFLAPLLMMVATTLSALGAFGMGAFVSKFIFDFPALDWTVPIYSFLFLVALGVDYSIFLVVRARQMVPDYGTKEAMVRAVAYTGGVITSAGIVLAAVFVVLGVLPLIVMAQVGIIVSLGVLLDTFLVRTLIIPALFEKGGNLMWWPSKLAKQDA
ncbi:MAG TPA: MMPL family transporter [Corynebacteriales bacterium]|nr:MMPL family transporter [Mycobacteriales bacterium]